MNKYGCHGAGPYPNLKEVIESAVTNVGHHTPLNETCVSSESPFIIPRLKTVRYKSYVVDLALVSKEMKMTIYFC